MAHREREREGGVKSRAGQGSGEKLPLCTRETDIERSMDRVTRKKYRHAAPGELALQKECKRLTDRGMTRSNQKASNSRELRAPLGCICNRVLICRCYHHH
jgi:hypothetical protein